jgi:LacI family transcriptional regulator
MLSTRRTSAASAAKARPHVALLIETSLASGRDILNGIARYVREHRPWALYHEPHGLTESMPSWIRRWRGDGIIARVQTPWMAKELRASGVPVIDVLGVVPGLPFPLVHVDNTAIGRLAAEHLLERGLTHFAFFGIRGENWSVERFAGFAATVAPVQNDVALRELPRGAMDRRSWERVENDVARWVAALPKPVGILVCSDQRGAQILEACRRAGVAVPDEVAVIGVDNDDALCEVCDPPLSSIDADHASVGYRAAALLDGVLSGAQAPGGAILVHPQRVVGRLSTDTLAIGDAAVATALKLIRERAHEGLGVPEIASRAGLSRSVLQRRFRRLLNRSIHQEIVGAKMKRAQDLLAKTDLPLALVAERAGFKHQEYMGAVFKARLGITPGKVRERSAIARAGRRPT